MTPPLKTSSYSIVTSSGTFAARFTHLGLVEIRFPNSKTATPDANTASSATQYRKWLTETRAALSDILAGKKPRSLPPLDWSGATAFQQSVWRALLGIDSGKTMSYSEIAAQIGHPGAARAVGGACGANPIPVLVPCHRVLAANRRIGGFSGGLDWKRQLLRNEGVAVAN